MVTGFTAQSVRVSRTSYCHVTLLLSSLLCKITIPFPPITHAADSSAVIRGTLWETGGNNTLNYPDGSLVRPILVARAPGPSFAAGFICIGAPCDGLLFAVFLVKLTTSGIAPSTVPQVVWCANRNDPIKGTYAALNLTTVGDLRLTDQHGRLVWSTNTSGRGVAAVKLTMNGNLILLDGRNRSIWQSYSHPTDTALFNQSLTGMKLVANVSAANSSEGPYFLSVSETSYNAYISVDHAAGDISSSQMYYKSAETLVQGVLFPVPNSSTALLLDRLPSSNATVDPSIFAMEFVRLEADGRLRKYMWQEGSSQWEPTDGELLKDNRSGCKYPTVCKSYGVCDSDLDCSCPGEEELNPEFELVNATKHKEGCRPLKSWTCGRTPRLVFYRDIGYFGYVQAADISNTDLHSCKQACLSRNCSCQAAFFRHNGALPDNEDFNNSPVRGDCYLPSTMYSMIRNSDFERNVTSLAFIKVLDAADQSDESGGSTWRRRLAVEISLPVLGFLVVLVGSVLIIRRQMSLRAKSLVRAVKGGDKDVDSYKFDQLPGMPIRFSFDDLEEATGGFTEKLGEGGFGAVFLGTLKDGTQVAVKILGYRGQGMKEFLAEVETIGSIHHHNLVRLVGYCAERLHRMLVYEYLVNNSLDKWIFINENNSGGVASGKSRLDFATKYKIILHVARGLSYLHEDCRQKIIHLDIKPQNILLDDNFNAKVSDFGLSKLVDREQSQVVTTMRGTLGYLAPEWVNSTITEKVDVYSFGVVVLEMVSGKKILDNTRSQGSLNLVNLLSKAAEEERLADIINGEDVDEEQAMRLVKVAAWCLQMDFTKRPSMSTVVKVLEGFMEVDPVPLGPWISPWVTSMSMTTVQASGSSMVASSSLWSDMARPR